MYQIEEFAIVHYYSTVVLALFEFSNTTQNHP